MIFANASKRLVGAVITQDDRPIAFFGRKLDLAQSKYNVAELELLSTVETLKEPKSMVFGQKIGVFTDHVNLTRDVLGMTFDCVHR